MAFRFNGQFLLRLYNTTSNCHFQADDELQHTLPTVFRKFTADLIYFANEFTGDMSPASKRDWINSIALATS
jgi:hypothetical protein